MAPLVGTTLPPTTALPPVWATIMPVVEKPSRETRPAPAAPKPALGRIRPVSLVGSPGATMPGRGSRIRSNGSGATPEPESTIT